MCCNFNHGECNPLYTLCVNANFHATVYRPRQRRASPPSRTRNPFLVMMRLMARPMLSSSASRLLRRGCSSDANKAEMQRIMQELPEIYKIAALQIVEPMWTHIAEHASRELKLAPQNILDLACGPGEPACTLAKTFPAAKVTASDFTDGMLAQARERVVAASASACRLRNSTSPTFLRSPLRVSTSSRAALVSTSRRMARQRPSQRSAGCSSRAAHAS